MKRVEKWARMHGYDGYVMVNTYPQRAVRPSDMDDSAYSNVAMVRRNLECVSRLFEMPDFDIWAAWGTNAGRRKNGHLLDALLQIWQAFGKLGGCSGAKRFRLGAHGGRASQTSSACRLFRRARRVRR